MIRAPFDLRYMHEMAACAAPGIVAPAPDRRATARDLTARLHCLKALIDAERASAPVTAGNVH